MIGFIGDSWIDTYGNKSSWPFLVAQKLNINAEYHGVSGTSHWYAYQKFLQNFKKYQIIVFSHANYTRYPCVPKEEGNAHWNTGHVRTDYTSDFFKNVNPYYIDLFPDDLLTFICENIFKKVNQLCQENNIYLINLFPYSVNYSFTNTEFPVVHKLYEASQKEKVIIDEKQYNTFDVIKGKDFRLCHFNYPNNVMISNVVTNLIQNKTKNKLINLLKYPITVFDENTDKIAGNYI